VNRISVIRDLRVLLKYLLEIYFVGFVDTLIEHHELPVAVCGVEMEVL